MTHPATMVEIWRGQFLESWHQGHAVVCDAKGEVVAAWGNPDAVILPRSSAKMVQALPLVATGAAREAGLDSERLALACASHSGAAIHTDRVQAWLEELGLEDSALRCGPQMPEDREAMRALIKADAQPCQLHNNCSGKHAGFLTLARHLKAGPEYVEPNHAVQRLVREVFEEVTGEVSPGFGVDGCSAPNFATSLRGMARAMAWYSSAARGNSSGRLESAAADLFQAMTRHPELVAGENRACTRLMRAMEGRVAVKTGAEGVFVAILPERSLGVALKIVDGATRASEAAIAALLIRLGVLDPDHPVARDYVKAPLLNRRGLVVGNMRAVQELWPD